MITDNIICLWFFSRLVEKLRKKSKREIEIEKKEKGFTLYLNALADKQKHKTPRAKTAGEGECYKVFSFYLFTVKYINGSDFIFLDIFYFWKLSLVTMKVV